MCNSTSSSAIKQPRYQCAWWESQKDGAPKHKRARLIEGAKLTLEALSILKKGDVVEKLRSSPLKNKQVMDKRRADKSLLVNKASKKTKLWLELVCTC